MAQESENVQNAEAAEILALQKGDNTVPRAQRRPCNSNDGHLETSTKEQQRW